MQQHKIYTVLDLYDILLKTPELRLGQLLMNFISEYGDIFYMSDEDLIHELNIYVNTLKKGE